MIFIDNLTFQQLFNYFRNIELNYYFFENDNEISFIFNNKQFKFIIKDVNNIIYNDVNYNINDIFLENEINEFIYNNIYNEIKKVKSYDEYLDTIRKYFDLLGLDYHDVYYYNQVLSGKANFIIYEMLIHLLSRFSGTDILINEIDLNMMYVDCHSSIGVNKIIDTPEFKTILPLCDNLIKFIEHRLFLYSDDISIWSLNNYLKVLNIYNIFNDKVVKNRFLEFKYSFEDSFGYLINKIILHKDDISYFDELAHIYLYVLNIINEEALKNNIWKYLNLNYHKIDEFLNIYIYNINLDYNFKSYAKEYGYIVDNDVPMYNAPTDNYIYLISSYLICLNKIMITNKEKIKKNKNKNKNIEEYEEILLTLSNILKSIDYILKISNNHLNKKLYKNFKLYSDEYISRIYLDYNKNLELIKNKKSRCQIYIGESYLYYFKNNLKYIKENNKMDLASNVFLFFEKENLNTYFSKVNNFLNQLCESEYLINNIEEITTFINTIQVYSSNNLSISNFDLSKNLSYLTKCIRKIESENICSNKKDFYVDNINFGKSYFNKIYKVLDDKKIIVPYKDFNSLEEMLTYFTENYIDCFNILECIDMLPKKSKFNKSLIDLDFKNGKLNFFITYNKNDKYEENYMEYLLRLRIMEIFILTEYITLSINKNKNILLNKEEVIYYAKNKIKSKIFLLEMGIENLLNKNYVVSLSMFVQYFEYIIREILYKNNKNILSKKDLNEEVTLLNVLPLNGFIKTDDSIKNYGNIEEKSNELFDIVGKNIFNYLLITSSDYKSLNIRNNVSHTLYEYGDYSEIKCLIMLKCILLVISKY